MKTTLCIDADAGDRSRVKTAAEQAGYQVLTAATARHALELFTTHRVDGILLDPKLPDLDGASLCRRLERIDPSVPVVFFAGAEAATAPLRCLDAYIRHPEAPDALLSRIQTIA